MVGLGLRNEHLQYILKNKPKVPLFELLADNYLLQNGIILQQITELRKYYDNITLHCVNLSVGSTINKKYLAEIKKLANNLNISCISDHLCWSHTNNHYSHDLLPLPYTKEALKLVIKNVDIIQNELSTQLLLENVSSYVLFNNNTMTEWQFLNEVVEATNCGILLDINNIYINSINHNFDIKKYLTNISKKSVKQLHLAGHTQYANILVDTHGEDICNNVWQLYKDSINYLGKIPTIIERDQNIPDFNNLYQEMLYAQNIMDTIL